MPSSVSNEGPSKPVYIGVSTKMYLGYQASLRWLEQVREVVDARPNLMADGRVQLFIMRPSRCGRVRGAYSLGRPLGLAPRTAHGETDP